MNAALALAMIWMTSWLHPFKPSRLSDQQGQGASSSSFAQDCHLQRISAAIPTYLVPWLHTGDGAREAATSYVVCHLPSRDPDGINVICAVNPFILQLQM